MTTRPPTQEGKLIGSAAGWVLKKVFVNNRGKKSALQREIEFIDKALEHVDSMPEARASTEDTDYSKLSQVEASGKACNVCLNDHFSTVSGALSEAIRFARKEGIQHPEVLSRISLSEDELNIGERVDGAPEKVAALAPDEKILMEEMLSKSRSLRHMLSDIRGFSDLESVAAEAQSARKEFRGKLFNMQMGRLSPEERSAIKNKAMSVIDSE